MTWSVTFAWWAVPVALVVIGVLAFLACSWWAGRQRGGYLSGMVEGLIGIGLFLICIFAALGILVGRWLA